MSTPQSFLEPAFPNAESERSPNTGQRDVYATTGMTLRQYFVAQAMAGLCAHVGNRYETSDGAPAIAAAANRIADAVLAVEKATRER